jgi:predicted esterase
MLLLATTLAAVQIGDSRDAVLAEKGPPVGRMEAAGVEILKYPAETLKLRDGKVIAIESVSVQATPESEIAPLEKGRPITFRSGTLIEAGPVLVYIPPGLESGKKHPLVFALSPSGDALSMIATWTAVADKRRWIVAASTEFKNGLKFTELLEKMETALTSVEKSHPVDSKRVIVTGFSGGGMGAHAFAKFYPERVRAVVINTGMIQPSFLTEDYPRGKTAVFIASPTDFRYADMKADRTFLEQRGWKTTWVEFEGGHAISPQEVYDLAAAHVADA